MIFKYNKTVWFFGNKNHNFYMNFTKNEIIWYLSKIKPYEFFILIICYLYMTKPYDFYGNSNRFDIFGKKPYELIEIKNIWFLQRIK